MIVQYFVFLLRMLSYLAAFVWSAFVLLANLPLMLIGAGVLLIAAMHLLSLGREVRYNKLYNAHWSSRTEIAPLKTQFGANGDGVLLGFAYGELLGIWPNVFGQKEMGHVLVSGPSRAGKGLHLTSELLSWRHSFVVVDIKGELYRTTAAHRAAMGQDVIMLSPTGEGHRYDPFSELATDEAIRSVVNVILDPEADGSNSAFARRATNVLFAMMKSAILLKQPVLPFVRRMTALGIERCCKQIAAVQDEQVQNALVDFLRDEANRIDWAEIGNNKYLDNSWTNMISKLQPLFSPGILKMTSASDVRALDLVTKPTTVYLVFRESELKYTGQAFTTVLLAIINTLIRHFDLNPDAQTIPLKFGFDEAGRLPVPELPDLVSTVAGRGMIAMIYVQSIAQLEGTYGEAGKTTILDNTHTKIFYRPKDEVTAEYISERCGQLMAEDVRHSADGHEGKISTGVGLRPRELVTGPEVMEWPVTRCVAFTEGAPIVLHRLSPFLLPGGAAALKRLPPPLPKYDYGEVTVLLPGEVLARVPAFGAGPKGGNAPGTPVEQPSGEGVALNNPLEI